MRGPGLSHRFSLLTLLLAAVLLAGCTSGAATPPAATPVLAPTAATPAPVATTAPAATALPTTALAPTVAPTTAATPTLAPASEAAALPWWNDHTFYEIFVRSFQDSDGDGIGDFKGLISRLDYLNDGDPDTTSDLGITGIWLMPIMPSPSYHGYDVTDYKAINPQYGTLEDFRAFLDEAHQRGIKVIIDLVMNHTSSQHPWFLEAMQPGSARRDWYVWSAAPSGNGWHGSGDEKYYGAFGDHMPDLNYRNPQVSEAMFDIVKFWLQDVKIDGFRLDAIKYLVEEGDRTEHAAATLAWLEEFYAYYKGLNPDAFTVGEVWSDSFTARSYLPSRVDVVFEFDLAGAMVESAQFGFRVAVEDVQANVNRLYPPGQFATFLTNHDQDRVRSRVRDDGRAAVAASMYLLYPGVPFIYYGEEIGMQGAKPDEDIRRPMQWTAEGGFTTGQPWRPYFGDQDARNVAAQDADPASLLNHYRALIRLRSTYPALRTGAWRPVTAPNNARSVYSFLRSQGDEHFLILINLGRRPVTDYSLTLEPEAAAKPSGGSPTAEIVYGPANAGEVAAPPAGIASGFAAYRPLPALPPYSTFVIRYLP